MKKIIYLLASICVLSACTDLNVNPDSQMTDQTTFKDTTEFYNGLAGVYSTNNWSEIVFKSGAASDEMIFPARGSDWQGDLQPLQDHSWKATNGELNGLYVGVSKEIAVSNSFIDAIDKNPLKSNKMVDEIRNETRFFRAFAYFEMIDFFGNVPLVTTSTYDASNPPAQNTRAELFAFVESELKDLINMLPDHNDYGRVDKYAAETLLAKLYLNSEVYLGAGQTKWQEVAALTKDVMDGGNYILEDDFKKVFAWDNYKSKEIIFSMVCDSRLQAPENISYLFSLNDLTAKYGSYADGWGGVSTLPTFYKAYDTNDVRLQAFLAGPQVGADGKPIIAINDDGNRVQLDYTVDFQSADPTYQQTHKGSDPVYNAAHWDGARGVKYLMDGIGGTMVERGLNNDMPILRYADVLMMRAEALYRINPSDAEALALVNKVRTRNGNNPIAPFTSLTADNLLAERGREFAWEGWRRNDLIRFNKWGDAWDFKPVSDENHKLFPIPKIQIDSNHNLKQNPGY